MFVFAKPGVVEEKGQEAESCAAFETEVQECGFLSDAANPTPGITTPSGRGASTAAMAYDREVESFTELTEIFLAGESIMKRLERPSFTLALVPRAWE